MTQKQFVDATLALYDQLEEIRVTAGLQDAAPVAHGWYTAVRRWARAALVLEDAGFGHEAAPLRRSMIEHALAIHWLVAAPVDALTALARSSQLIAQKMQAAMDDQWTVPAEVFDAIRSVEFAPSAEDRNLHFTSLAKRFSQDNLYVAWLHESQYCHPSLVSAQAYLSIAKTRETQLLLHPEEADGFLPQTIVSLLIASEGFNQVLDGAPWTEQLTDLVQRFVSAHRASSAPKQ